MRCLADPTAGRPSIETLLHAFLPATHVDHTHADTICALTKTPDGPRHVAAALGDDVAYVPYVRPGFALSRLVGDLAGARAVVLAHHGLVTWGETHEESEDLTHELVDRAGRYLEAQSQRTGATQPRQTPVGRPSTLGEAEADELLVRLRGRLSAGRGRKVLRVDRAQRRFADRPDVAALAALGPATADHILRLHTGSLVVDGPAEVEQGRRRLVGRLHVVLRPEPPPARTGTLPTSRCTSPCRRRSWCRAWARIAAAPTARRARVVGEVAEHTHAVAARALDAYLGHAPRASARRTCSASTTGRSSCTSSPSPRRRPSWPAWWRSSPARRRASAARWRGR